MSEQMTGKKGLGGYYGLTFLIGIGFFTMGLMDPLYDSFVPMFLAKYIPSKGVIGTIMTLDNIFAILLIPIVSALSDRTRTGIGRRMPYILVTLPLTAIFFGIVPSAALRSLAFLVIALFLLNLFKQAARGPVVALMPDIIPGEYRSEANGVINSMGGIAAIVGTVGLARLMDLDTVWPVIGNTKDKLPFVLSGILVVLATLVLFLFVKEKHADQKTEKREPFFSSIKVILANQDKSALFILLSVFLWFMAYQGVLPFIAMYTMKYLGVSKGTSALSVGMVGISYAIFAIPSGVIAHKIGRRKTIRISLAAVAILGLLLFLHQPATALFSLSQSGATITFFAIMFAFGIFWVSIVTNSFPMLWQMANYNNMGVYTGLYYTSSQLASILAPPITGFLIDAFGFRALFPYLIVFILAAFLTMGFVRRGEALEGPDQFPTGTPEDTPVTKTKGKIS
jgi:maltose/moltooligosaccharide transporter